MACALAAICAGCGGSSDGGSGDASGRLTVLSSSDPVAQAFNADKGHARLVLLLSPT
jgi:hypothetical protein